MSPYRFIITQLWVQYSNELVSKQIDDCCDDNQTCDV